ncbi:MAG: hypothetical protein RMJ56_03755 [Gemmataceae bacterium]|nr:hypothetical protein [Gemmata sp.]MDW8196704.1 hypothetical protein [Gemmataceae bacterium]
MKRIVVPMVPILLMAVPVTSVRADEKPAQPKADPATTPLEMTITGKTTKYTLDLGAQSAEEFKKAIEAAAKAGQRPPAAPAVDLTIQIKNTSDKPVQVWKGGDPVVLTLTLKGPGAVNVAPLLAFTQEFRAPVAAEVGAGKTLEIPVKSLMSGFRGAAHWAYWTEPGEYELIATFKTGVSPAPQGSAEGMDGFGIVTLTSPPFKLTVEAKK